MADSPEPAPADSIRRNTAFALVVQITTTTFVAFVTLYLLRALGPSGFGVFALCLGIGGIARLIATFGIDSSVARFLAESRSDEAACAALLRDGLRLTLLTSSLVSVTLFAAAVPIADAYNDTGLVWPLRWMAVAVFAEALTIMYTNAFSALARISFSVRVVLVEGLTESAATVALVAAGGGAAGAAFGRATGYLVAACLAAAITMRLYGRLVLEVVGGQGIRGRSREIVKYALPLAAIDFLFGLYARVDTLIISAVLTTTATGFFSAPMRLTTALGQLGSAAAAGVSPRQASGDRVTQRVDAFLSALRWLLILQAMLIAPLVVWAKPIVDLLFGSEYADSVLVLQLLVPYVLLRGVSPVIASTVVYLGKAAKRVPITASALAVNIVIDLALLPVIGISAAAIGTSVAYCLYVPANLRVCRQELGFPLTPVVLTLVRSLAAAVAMCVALYVIGGTTSLTPLTAVIGGVVGLIVFLVTLLVTHELSRAELVAAWRAFRMSRRG